MMRIFLILPMLLLLLSCASPEEIARMQAERQALLDQRAAAVQQRIVRRYGSATRITVDYRGPETGIQPAYEYVRLLGGSITERRAARFELRVTTDIISRLQESCRVQIVSQFIEKSSAVGGREVLAQGAIERSVWDDCRNPERRFIEQALFAME